MNSFTGGGGVFGRVGPVFLQVFVSEKMLIYCFTRKKTPRFFFSKSPWILKAVFFFGGFKNGFEELFEGGEDLQEISGNESRWRGLPPLSFFLENLNVQHDLQDLSWKNIQSIG